MVAKVAQREPSTRDGDSRVCTVLHAPGGWQIGPASTRREASRSSNDRRSRDRAGGGALDPTDSDPRAARHDRVRRRRRCGRVYPLLSPLRYAGTLSVAAQLVSILNGAVWLAVLLIVMVRQPEGRLWKLIFVWSLASRIYAFSYVPDSLVWSVARPLEILSIAAYVHLAIAYPTGYLRNRFDRGVVLYVYVLLVGQALIAHPFWEVTVACVPNCVRNVFAVVPNADVYGLITNGGQIVGVVTVVPLILVALWQHWRDASPAGRRALLPVVVAFPIEAVLAAADALVRAVSFQPGIAFFDGSSGQALRLVVPMILPLGLLITFLRPRLNRGRMASLVVELGRGVPLGGLRDVLARALGDPSLQLAFAAPSGSGYVDAAGQPVDLPVADPTRTVTRLERGDELLGVLVHDPLIEVEDPGLVEAVGNAARLALENERLAAEVRAQLEEVRASRVRIVEAADAERRRVERDLHDGAQQRLVALAMRLQVAKQSTPEAAALSTTRHDRARDRDRRGARTRPWRPPDDPHGIRARGGHRCARRTDVDPGGRRRRSTAVSTRPSRRPRTSSWLRR